MHMLSSPLEQQERSKAIKLLIERWVKSHGAKRKSGSPAAKVISEGSSRNTR
jgi:multimeric flavodoxin WrbA